MEISFKPEIVGFFFGFPISNSFILSVVTSFVLVGGGIVIARSLCAIPGKVQNGAEIIIEAMLDFFSQTLASRELAKRFFPLIATTFLFILFNNWIGILPGTGSLGFFEQHEGKERFVPLFRSANSDLNTTFALAFISVGAIQIFGIRKSGFFGHLSKFFVLHRGPVYFFVGLLELIGEFAKIVSFSFRLFGNIFAGEVLLLIVMALAPILAPSPFLLLELFVGFVQALVFAALTLIFLKVAIAETEHSS